jgi:hypothetical protein
LICNLYALLCWRTFILILVKSGCYRYAWCLPSSKEEERLASVKLGVPSNSVVLEPVRYDATVLMIEATEA